MGWLIKFATDDGEKVVDLDDLSPEIYDAIAAEDADANNYWDVYSNPVLNLERTYKILDAAAELAKIDKVERGSLSTGELNRMVTFGTPIADQPMQEGFPQVPGEPESGSTSGAPGDSDGTESSVVDSQ